jgi:uncharacterized protein (TIGR03435 family)
MTRTILLGALCALESVSSWAHPADDPTFEVASVKLAVPPEGRNAITTVRMDGGPGTQDPTRIDYQNVSISNLITQAYGLNHWQLSGGPDWMNMPLYDITARVPAGATKEQFQLMLQNLLAQRFSLQVHRETKELPTYSLTVGKNGSKLKPHVEVPSPPDTDGKPAPEESGRPKLGADGYPILSGGTTMAMMNGRARVQMIDKDVAWLVGQLSAQLGGPVSDETGLTGKYDIALYWSSRRPNAQTDADNEPDLIAAVQQQLGLRLEKKKGPSEMLAIDHVDKEPTGN